MYMMQNTKQPNQQKLALNNLKKGWYAIKLSISQSGHTFYDFIFFYGSNKSI